MRSAKELAQTRDDLEEQLQALLNEFPLISGEGKQVVDWNVKNIKVHLGVGDHEAMRLVADIVRVK